MESGTWFKTGLNLPTTPARLGYTDPTMSNKINLRLAVIATVLAMLVGYPAYALVRNHLNGGIEKTGDEFKVDLKRLGCFAFDDRTDTAAAVPPQFAALDGSKVVLDGFVFSDDAGIRLHTFQLVYNIQRCCINGPPQVQERVFGTVPKGLCIDTPSQNQFVRCTGILRVKLVRDPESQRCIKLYAMDVQGVEPL
jgi:hypothetical protein